MSSKSTNSHQYSSYLSRSDSNDKHNCDHKNYNKRRENQDHVKSKHRSRSRSRSYDRIDSHDRFSSKRNYNRDFKLSHSNEKSSQLRNHSRSKNICHEPFPSTSSNLVDTEISKQYSTKLEIRPEYKEERKQEVVIESVFKNDGSFLEMFKQMHGQSTTNAKQAQNNLPVPIVGRRRGGKVLKTGVVEKAKVDEVNEDNKSTDPWAIYINEVKKYRQTSCQDEAKTRSLVK